MEHNPEIRLRSETGADQHLGTEYAKEPLLPRHKPSLSPPAALDNVTITSQLEKWEADADHWRKPELKQNKEILMVGLSGRF